jgi:Na+/melibiose symporter-like transporter
VPLLAFYYQDLDIRVSQQTPTAVTGIIFLLSAGPSISYIAMSLLTHFYKLDDNMLNKMRIDVDARRKQVNESGLVANADGAQVNV